MPRKSKNNKRTSSSSGTTIASRRHWIYAATTTTTKNDTHQNYLHQRVQRILVRSVPSTYSYFDGAVNDGAFLIYVSIVIVLDIFVLWIDHSIS